MTDAPKLYAVVLPPSHPFVRLSTDEFEALFGALFGAHAYLVISRPIPVTPSAESERRARDFPPAATRR